MDDALKAWLGDALSADGTTLTLRLDPPHKIGDVETGEIVLREPTIGQMEEAAKKSGAIEGDVALIQAIAGVPAAAVRRLSARDYRKVQRFLGFFMDPGPPAGATS